MTTLTDPKAQVIDTEAYAATLSMDRLLDNLERTRLMAVGGKYLDSWLHTLESELARRNCQHNPTLRQLSIDWLT